MRERGGLVKGLDWAKNFFGDMKLKYKMLLSYVVLIVAPIFILTSIVVGKCAGQLLSDVSYSAEQGYEQTRSFLEYKLSKIMLASNMIFTSQTVNEIMMRPLSGYEISDQISDMVRLREYLQSFQDKEDVYQVRLYVRDDLIYADDRQNLFPMSLAEGTAWYEKNKALGNVKAAFLSYQDIEPYEQNEEPLLSVSRMVVSQQNYRKSLGVFRVDFKRENLERILQKADPTNDSRTFLLSEEGDLVASSRPLPADWGVAGEGSFLSRLRVNAGSFQEVTINGEKALVQVCRLADTSWRMVTVVPYASLMGQINSLRTASFVLALAVSSIACIFAVFLSRSITVRITRLARRMGEMRQGHTNVEISNTRRDEIGELYNNYNYLIERINDLLQQQYEMGQALKSVELKALQSQINPHFLYNTLDMINWYGYKKEPEQINAVVTALAKFYKQSLNKGSDIVTVEDELKHVSYYMQIQTLRFSGKIRLWVEVDPAVRECAVPKITLQPIVENAILHGILEKDNREGNIRIEGRQKGGQVEIIVMDDGVGMDQKTLDKLNGGYQTQAGGFGLANINQRLQLLFGAGYGLCFESEQGKGTAVTILLPASPQRDLRPPADKNH